MLLIIKNAGTSTSSRTNITLLEPLFDMRTVSTVPTLHAKVDGALDQHVAQAAFDLVPAFAAIVAYPFSV